MNIEKLFDADEAEKRLRPQPQPRQPQQPQPQPRPSGYVDHPLLLPIEWYERWEERAAIREYDGGYPRDEAERLALVEINEQMQRERGQ